MKLSKQEKMDRQVFMEELDLAGGMVRSCKPVDQDDWGGEPALNGFTVAIMPAMEWAVPNSDFFYVAVSNCSPNEKFRRKRGELVALERLNGGEFLRVPAVGRSMIEVVLDTMNLMRADG